MDVKGELDHYRTEFHSRYYLIGIFLLIFGIVYSKDVLTAENVWENNLFKWAPLFIIGAGVFCMIKASTVKYLLDSRYPDAVRRFEDALKDADQEWRKQRKGFIIFVAVVSVIALIIYFTGDRDYAISLLSLFIWTIPFYGFRYLVTKNEKRILAKLKTIPSDHIPEGST